MLFKFYWPSYPEYNKGINIFGAIYFYVVLIELECFVIFLLIDIRMGEISRLLNIIRLTCNSMTV